MKTQGVIHLLVLMLVLAAKPVFSQNDEKSIVLGNPGDTEIATNIVADDAGNTYVGGMQNDKGLVVKQNAAHVVLWSKRLTFPFITPTANNTAIISFLDLVGDTVFGCGRISNSNFSIGAFYFKMNAQTGALYWFKNQVASDGYFSCMRYANGKFFLVGGSTGTTTVCGKVMAVSSQTGNSIWQTPLLRYSLVPVGTFLNTNWSQLFDATEMVNGKMFITGKSGGFSSFSVVKSLPVLIGIDESGSVFLEKYISLPLPANSAKHYVGSKIRYDMDQNVVITCYNVMDPSVLTSPIGNLVLVKCDNSGNLLFCKDYYVGNNYMEAFVAMNETPTSYVLFGINQENYTKGYVLKLAKDGSVQKCNEISKPGIAFPYINQNHYFYGFGNSTFLNGKHYFVANEQGSSLTLSDIGQIFLDEDLNPTEGCSNMLELVTTSNTIPTTLNPLVVANVPNTMFFQNNVIVENPSFTTYCDNISLNLVQNTGCNQSIITANTAGFIGPTFQWSNGITSSVDSITVNTTDTIFVRVLDTKCCELFDTIVPVLLSSSMTMNLPADTTLCLEPGNSILISPLVSNSTLPVQYLWSNGTTGSSLSVVSSGTYWVNVSDACSNQRDTIVVTINSLPVIGNTSDVIVCEDDFPATLSPTVSAGATIVWDDGTTSTNRTVNGPGIYTISITNDCGSVNASISVLQNNLPDVQLISLVDTCLQTGGSILLVPTFTDVNTISWSDGSTGNQLTVSTSGNYTVYGSSTCGMDSAICTVTLNYFPELDLPALLDTCFEIGVGFSYTAPGSSGFYQWSSGSQSATEWISQEGMYSVTLTNQCGSITDSMQVRRMIVPDLYFPEDSIRECLHQLAVSELQIETNYNLEILQPYHGTVEGVLTKPGWYTIHAFNGCWHKWDSIYVDLKDAFFYLPNSFTPNADLNNERFEFEGENIAVREVRIFNRWGEEIFTESGSFTGWDGTYLGENCPDGIYAVHLIYEDCFGIPTEFSGHVNLIR